MCKDKWWPHRTPPVVTTCEEVGNGPYLKVFVIRQMNIRTFIIVLTNTTSLSKYATLF